MNYTINPENGLHIEKNVKDVKYTVYYKHSDFLVYQELQAYKQWTDSLIQHYRNLYHSNLYFILSISQDGQEVLNQYAGNRQQFGSMVNQLAFGMKQNISLTTSNKDTLQLQDYIYPRMYGVGNSTDILFAFKKQDIKNADWLLLKIKDFGLQTGDINFKFLTQNIEKTPAIKLEKE